MAKGKDALAEFARPMGRQAANDFKLAVELGNVVGRDERFACNAVSLLAQATEKLIKAWLLSCEQRGIAWALDWMKHDVFAQLDSSGPIGDRRRWLKRRLGDSTYRELKKLLELLPRAGWKKKNVEYPYTDGAAPVAPCDGFTGFDYQRFQKAVKVLNQVLESKVHSA